MATKEKSYAELKAEAAKHWQEIQALKEAQLRNQAAQLAQTPDVLMKPDPQTPWSHDGLVCPCGGTAFRVGHWVTVSGIRYRFDAVCTSCQEPNTWDWSLRAWLRPAEVHG